MSRNAEKLREALKSIFPENAESVNKATITFERSGMLGLLVVDTADAPLFRKIAALPEVERRYGEKVNGKGRKETLVVPESGLTGLIDAWKKNLSTTQNARKTLQALFGNETVRDVFDMRLPPIITCPM